MLLKYNDRPFHVAFEYFRFLRMATIQLGDVIRQRQEQQPVEPPLFQPKMFQLFPDFEAGVKFMHIDDKILRWLFQNPVRPGEEQLQHPGPDATDLEIWLWAVANQQYQLTQAAMPIPADQEDPWGHVFNLKAVHLPWTPTKTISIKTDGVSLHVSYSREELKHPLQEFDRRKTRQQQPVDPNAPLPRTGVIKLEDIANHQQLLDRLMWSLVHGIDPGVIDVLRVVRESEFDPAQPLAARKNVDPRDNFCLSGAAWQKAIMTKYFERKDLELRQHHAVQEIFTELAQTGARRNQQEWSAYLTVQFRNFDALSLYHNDKSHRRARRTKKIMRQSMLDRIRNAIFSPGSPLAPMRRINLDNPQAPGYIPAHVWTNIQPEAKIYLEAAMPPVVAWGSAFFGNRRGRHSLPVKLFQEYIGRFALVILVPEHLSSQQCPCGDDQVNRTVPYQVDGSACNHQKRRRHYGPPIGNRKSRVYCFLGTRRNLTARVGRYHHCPQRQVQHLQVVRHRMCQHCRYDDDIC